MKPTSRPSDASSAGAPPAQSRFAEHRPASDASAPTPSKAAVNPPVKSDEIAANATLPAAPADTVAKRPKEIGGPKGPEPTRYGDWERDGRCVDF